LVPHIALVFLPMTGSSRKSSRPAYHSFQTGLNAALALSAALVIGAGLLTAVTLRRRPA
jgi:hypothetical protein